MYHCLVSHKPGAKRSKEVFINWNEMFESLRPNQAHSENATVGNLVGKTTGDPHKLAPSSAI